MAYCHGCGRFVGDYSAYRHTVPGEGDFVLCYKCKHWAERHPGQSTFPSGDAYPPAEGRRVRTYAAIYLISSVGLFALGATLVLTGTWTKGGALFLLGGVSLFLIGLGMRRSQEK